MTRLRAANGALRIAAAVVFAAALLLNSSAFAQDQPQGEAKIPTKLSKIRGGDDSQLAFTGKIQNVDVKLKLLSMTPEEGKGSEIFPVKKNTIIRTAKGERIYLKDLKEGTSIVVYYQLKGAQRVVKRIIELSAGKDAEGKNPPS